MILWIVRHSNARNTINAAPVIEMKPRIKSEFETRSKTNNVNAMIGASVKRGAEAILKPSNLLCFSVSEMTSVRVGPGVIPDEMPNTIPEIKIANISKGSSIGYLFFRKFSPVQINPSSENFEIFLKLFIWF